MDLYTSYREKRIQKDDIRCHNQEKADIRFQDGALRHVLGACCYQIIRGAKDLDVSPEGRGFTYNHAPMLAWFHGKFVLEYLGGPNGEHEPPSAAFVTFSADGRNWEAPREAFGPITVPAAPYKGPGKETIQEEYLPCIVHHRMGFYTAKSGRLLMMTFYGLSPDCHMIPNNGYGVGRVVREIYPDFTMSPIYWLRCNETGGYGRGVAGVYPWFEEAEDAGFVEACHELLANRLVTQQWWEEERLDTEFFTRPDGRALAYYTLPDGRVMGVFKDSLTSWSDDQGEHWSPIRKSVSIETSNGKVWGQKTPDGRYILAYNPSPDGAHRWPLAVQTGDNGVDFDGLAAIMPEISPCRYEGQLKNLGAQYMRGITEANQRPEDMAMWLAYSVNKEDIWICRVPVPVRMVSEESVNEDMRSMTEETLRNTWNLYVPSWGSAELISGKESCKQQLLDMVSDKSSYDETKENANYGLLLTDCDPWQRTRAMRILKSASRIRVRLELEISRISEQPAAIFLQDRHGQNAVSLVFRPDGCIALRSGGADAVLCHYRNGKRIQAELIVDTVANEVLAHVVCGEEEGEKKVPSSASVCEIERILFTTKYTLPYQGLEVNGKLGNIGNLPNADKRIPETAFWIMQVEETVLEE